MNKPNRVAGIRGKVARGNIKGGQAKMTKVKVRQLEGRNGAENGRLCIRLCIRQGGNMTEREKELLEALKAVLGFARTYLPLVDRTGKSLDEDWIGYPDAPGPYRIAVEAIRKADPEWGKAGK